MPIGHDVLNLFTGKLLGNIPFDLKFPDIVCKNCTVHYVTMVQFPPQFYKVQSRVGGGSLDKIGLQLMTVLYCTAYYIISVF